MNTDKYEKLAAKLRELFQLDQPDLDFGFYRVMHAKQTEVTKFLDETLPNIVSSAFQSTNDAKLTQDFASAKTAVENSLGPQAFKEDGIMPVHQSESNMRRRKRRSKPVRRTAMAR